MEENTPGNNRALWNKHIAWTYNIYLFLSLLFTFISLCSYLFTVFYFFLFFFISISNKAWYDNNSYSYTNFNKEHLRCSRLGDVFVRLTGHPPGLTPQSQGPELVSRYPLKEKYNLFVVELYGCFPILLFGISALVGAFCATLILTKSSIITLVMPSLVAATHI